MTDKEALKLALEYLRDNQHHIADNERHAYVMEYNAFVERLEALAEQTAQQYDQTEIAFEAWWKAYGQFHRSGGGDYEKTFAWHAWLASLACTEQPAQQQEPEYKGWYCAHCQRGVDASEVTYHEQHTVCGRVITDDLPPKAQQHDRVRELECVIADLQAECKEQPAQQQEPIRRKGAHWTEDYPDSPVLDDFPIATQPSKPSYEELERIADDLQALCDKQAIRLGKLEAQQQEPIAWIERDMNCDEFDPDSITYQKPDTSVDGWEWVPLYTKDQL